MKRTLLDLTQDILSALDSDEVNSISDTTESLQVATVIKNTWLNMITRAGLPEQSGMFRLEASTDNTLPVLMFKPSNVNTIEWVKYYDESTSPYDTTGFIHDLNLDIEQSPAYPSKPDLNYKDIVILPIKEFLYKINRYNPYEDNIESYTIDGITLRYQVDKQPEYCTVLSDYQILFDSFDSSVEDTLQHSKTQCYGQKIPEFKMEDDFIPLLDDYQFPLLYNEAKSLAFFELKQTPHVKAEQESKRQWSSLNRDKYVAKRPNYFDELPNYGRK